MTVLLGLLGLSTRGELQRALARKSRWHGLVRDVFAQYYAKFQELAVGYMPDLPRRWSTDWESSIRQELEEFRRLDLHSVASLLDTCGFGTERWERIKKAGFPALQRLIEEEILSGNGRSNGDAQQWMDRVEAAVGEDLQHLMAWHPDAFIDLIRKIDLESGQLVLSEEELQASEAFLQMRQRLADAELVIRKLRTGGRRALDQIRELEAQVSLLRKARQGEARPAGVPAAPRSAPGGGGGEADGFFSGDPAVVEMAREIEELEGRVASRDRTIAGFEERVRELEARLAASAARALRTGPAEAPEGAAEDAPRDPGVVELADEIRDLEAQLKARDHTIDGLRQELARYEALAGRTGAGRAEGEEEVAGGADPAAQIKQLTAELKAREHDAEQLREELERLGRQSEKTRVSRETEDAGVQLQLQQLRNDVRTRDHTIDGLQERLQKLQAEVDAAQDASARERAKAAGDLDLARENQALRRDVRAREETIRTLRAQVEKFEAELSQARDQLVSEVQKLAAIASGEVALKPAEELSRMDADQLLGYAREVAEDLDVRRQTLTEGLQGIDSIKGSFDESRRVYEEQQRELQQQLEQLRAQMEEYERQQKAGEAELEVGSDQAREVIVKQRQQLDLLSTRIKQLTSSNRELDQNNKRIYADLEAAVRRVIPLRRQIEELENLQETLQRYIRQKYDRTFTVGKLKE